MTIDDITIVTELAHLKMFIYEVMRYINDGVPIANFFACSDLKGGTDENIIRAQKYIATALSKMRFFGGDFNCKFNVGDYVTCKESVESHIDGLCTKKEVKRSYRIKGFVDVCMSKDTYARGVLVESSGVADRVFSVSEINQKFELEQ